MINKDYITKPFSAKKYHIFDKDTNTSYCGKILLIKRIDENCEELQGDEYYHNSEDCKACFDKLNKKKK